jgi:hypothetical protein
LSGSIDTKSVTPLRVLTGAPDRVRSDDWRSSTTAAAAPTAAATTAAAPGPGAASRKSRLLDSRNNVDQWLHLERLSGLLVKISEHHVFDEVGMCRQFSLNNDATAIRNPGMFPILQSHQGRCDHARSAARQDSQFISVKLWNRIVCCELRSAVLAAKQKARSNAQVDRTTKNAEKSTPSSLNGFHHQPGRNRMPAARPAANSTSVPRRSVRDVMGL